MKPTATPNALNSIVIIDPKPNHLRHFSFFTFHFSLPSLFTSRFSLAFVFHFLLTTLFTSAQQTNLDSLFSIWDDPSQADDIRMGAYIDYIWDGFLFSNPDTAVALAEALHDYAKKHQYRKAAAAGYGLQGTANSHKGIYPRATEYFNKALAIYEEIGDKKGIAVYLGNIGGIYNRQSNYPRALEYFQKSVAVHEELGDKTGIAPTLGNIGNIYSSLGNYPRALEYYEKSLAIFEEIGDNGGISIGLGNIGLIYGKQGNFPLALDYYQKSLAMKEKIGDQWGMVGNLNNIGDYYNSQGNYSLALENYQKALMISEEIGAKSRIAGSLYYIGRWHHEHGEATRAIDYCHKSLALAKEMGALDRQKNAYQCLYDAYKTLGKGNEALAYLEKMRVVEDSLKTKETAEKLQQMEFAKVMLQDSIAKAEEARLVHEAHQTEVRKKNQARNVFIGSSLFLLLLAGGLFSRWRYIRKSRDIISKEKDRSDNLLLNILPAEIAQELKEKGRAEARDFEMVSILFTDFKGFTEASAKLSAQDLVAEINTCFEAFDGIMAKYNIEKIKTIGDAYMAAGGLPVPTDDSVKNTVLAALEMQDFIHQRKSHNEAQGKPAFEMRVGIHTGPVVAGIVGVKKFQYDIWGDTVNTANRMETNSEAGKVNISQNTYERLKFEKDLTFQSRGKIEAKGKGEIEMYFVSKA